MGKCLGRRWVKWTSVTGSHLWRMKYLRYSKKNLLLNYKPVTRIWKKNVQLTKSGKAIKKTNCPKFIDIQWNERRNKVGTIRAWRHVFADISKAFDTVWVKALLYKLGKYGIKGDLLCWIKSYLSNRTQRVMIKDALSGIVICM